MLEGDEGAVPGVGPSERQGVLSGITLLLKQTFHRLLAGNCPVLQSHPKALVNRDMQGAAMQCSSGKGMATQSPVRSVRISRRTRLSPVAVAVDTKVDAVYSGKSVTPPKKGKHFLHLDDFSKEELVDMLDRAKYAKSKFYARDESFKPFGGMTMAMIFTKPSARTRVSFETVSRDSHYPRIHTIQLHALGSNASSSAAVGNQYRDMP